MSEGFNVYILAAVSFWMLPWRLFQNMLKTHSSNRLVVHGTWSVTCALTQSWKVISSLDLKDFVLRCVLVNIAMPGLCGMEH